MPINAKLVVVGGEVKTAEIKLRLPSTIGRGRGCTIMLPQALVSRQHCEIFESGGKIMVKDLGSLNGTFVNNQKIDEPSPVNSEELLTIGTVTFRVVYEGAGASSPPEGPGPVMKPASKETLSGAKSIAAPVVKAPSVAAVSEADDNSQPLEIGEIDFDDTVRPNSDTESPAPVSSGAKIPSQAFEMPAINVGQPEKKPAAAPAVVSVSAAAKPAAPVAAAAKPAPPPAAKPVVPAPVAAPLPAAAPVATAPAAPPAKAADTEEKAEEEDDFQDFLKSLGK